MIKFIISFLVVFSQFVGSEFSYGQERQKIGLIWQKNIGDKDDSFDIVKHNLSTKIVYVNISERYQDAVSGFRHLVSAERLDAIIVRTTSQIAARAMASIINEFDTSVVALGFPIPSSQAIFVGYDPKSVGRLQIEGLVQRGSSRISAINSPSRSPVASLVAQGQSEGLRQYAANISIIANCVECPATGDCPKSDQAQQECPCPKTGECPKSNLERFFSIYRVTGVATRDDLTTKLVREINSNAEIALVFPSAERAELELLSGRLHGALVWLDDEALAKKTAEIVSMASRGGNSDVWRTAGTTISWEDRDVPSTKAIWLEPRLIGPTEAGRILNARPR